jgi:hypothetical protein
MPLLTTQSAKGYGFGSLVTSAAVNSFESIATVTLSATTSSVVFSSIPATYKHLQLRGIMRSNFASTNADGYIQDSTPSSSVGTRYTHILRGAGTGSPNAENYTGIIEMARSSVPGTSASSNIYGAFICDILDYTSTNKNTVYQSFSGVHTNCAGVVELSTGFQTKSLATSQLTLDLDGSYIIYSSFALYGIKG